MKINFSLCLGLVTALAAAAPCAADDLFGDPVIAKGRDVTIKRSELDAAFVAYRANLASQGRDINEPERNRIEAQMLDRLIVTRLLVQLATPEDRVAAKSAEKKFLQEIGKAAETEGDFRRYLLSIGVTGQQFTNRLVEQAVAEQVITRELRNKIVIPEAEIEKAYRTNIADFNVPEMARVSHILLLTRDPATGRALSPDELKAKRATMDRALERVRGGEAFSKVVLEVSEDARAKETKGEFKFTRAKDDRRRATIPEVETAAFNMRPGQISDVISSTMGLHIVLLHEIIPARVLKLTDDLEGDTVGNRLRNVLVEKEVQKQMPGFFAKLIAGAKVEVLDNRLKEDFDRLEQARSAAAARP